MAAGDNEPALSGASSVWTENPSPEEWQLRPTLSGPFDQLHSGDVALDGPGTPRIPNSGGDRLQVVGHTRRQTRERLQVTGCSVKQPLLECRHVQLMERDAKALDELVAGIKQRVRCQDTLEIGSLVLFQQ